MLSTTSRASVTFLATSDDIPDNVTQGKSISFRWKFPSGEDMAADVAWSVVVEKACARLVHILVDRTQGAPSGRKASLLKTDTHTPP